MHSEKEAISLTCGDNADYMRGYDASVLRSCGSLAWYSPYAAMTEARQLFSTSVLFSASAETEDNTV